MGVSRAGGVKNSSSRKRKSESEKGKEVPKVPRGKAVKKEPEETPCTVQPPVVKGKKKLLKVKEKPLQENIISSSLKQEGAEGKGLGTSLWDGIQAEEGAASGLINTVNIFQEETELAPHQGPSVGLKDSSRSQRQPQRAGPAVGRQLSAIKAGVGVPKPTDGVAGGAASLSGEPGALEMDVAFTTMREGEEKELDPPVPQQRGDAQDLKRKKEREKKQEQRKQQEKRLLRKGGSKKDEFEERPGDVMEGIEEEGADGGRNRAAGCCRAKQGSSSTQGQGDGRQKQKGKAEKRKKVKTEGEEKMGKKKIKKEKMLEEEQELEKTDEEKGVRDEVEERDGVGKESKDGKGVKEEEEELDEKGDERWGETQSPETGLEVKEEEKDKEEAGKGDVPGKEKKRKIKKEPEREMKEKKSKEKSEEEKTPGKTRKRKSKEEGKEKNNKKAKKEDKEEEKEAENKWKCGEEETNRSIWKKKQSPSSCVSSATL
ncbi:uncharacterized protein LJ206_014385 [Theristicus caerulescens]